MGKDQRKIGIEVDIQTTLSGMDKVVSEMQKKLKEGSTQVDMTKGIGKSLQKQIENFQELSKKFGQLTKDNQIDFGDAKEVQKTGAEMLKIFKTLQNTIGDFNNLTVLDAKKLFPQAFKQEVDNARARLETIKSSLEKLDDMQLKITAQSGSIDETKNKIEELKAKVEERKTLNINFDNAQSALNAANQAVDELREKLRESIKLKIETSEEDIKKLTEKQVAATGARQSLGVKEGEFTGGKGNLAFRGKQEATWLKQADSEERTLALQALEARKQELEVIEQLKIKTEELNQLRKAQGEENLVKAAISSKAPVDEVDAITSALQRQKQATADNTRAQQELRAHEKAHGDVAVQFERTTTTLEKQETELTRLRGEYDKLDKEIDTNGLIKLLKDLGVERISGLDITPELLKNEEGLKKMLSSLSAIDNARLDILKSSLKSVGFSSEETARIIEAMNKALEQTGNSAKAISDADKEIEQLTNNLKNFFSLGNSIQLFKRAITSAMNTVKELDATMTEAAVVTDFSVGDMWNKLPTYADEAQKLGVSINGLYGATTLYYQQGLKTNEAMALGIETMKMARIAGMESAEATEAMTAALRGFNMELNEASATQVNDVYSKLAAVTAADTNQIATAMSKTASIAASANMEFETTAALLAQIIETTQEAPETAGTALKTIIARFSEVKSLQNKGESSGKDAEGEDIDVNKIQTALRSVGISMNDFFAGTEGLDSVLMELAEKWDTLDFTTQRYIATTAAGSRQQSRFIAMMSDYARTTELVGAAQNSAGASQMQFNKTLDSMDAKLQQLENAWNEFLMGLANSEILKAGVDFLTSLLSGINGIIDKMSLGQGVFKSVVSLLITISTLKIGKGIFTGFTDGLKDVKKGISKSGTLPQQAIGDDSKNKTIAEKSGENVANNFVNKIISTLTARTDEVQAAKEGLLSEGGPKAPSSQQTPPPPPQETPQTPQPTPRSKNWLVRQASEVHTGIEETAEAMDKFNSKVQEHTTTINTLATGFMSAGLACGFLSQKFEESGNEQAAEGWATASSVFTGIATVMSILPGLINGVTVAMKLLSAATATVGGVIGVIVTVVAALATVVIAWVTSMETETEKIEKKMSSLQKEINSFSEASSSASSAVDELTEALSRLSKTNPFEGLIEGTKEWQQALLENNQYVLDLIAKYPTLEASYGEYGELTIATQQITDLIKMQNQFALLNQRLALASQMELESSGLALKLSTYGDLPDAGMNFDQLAELFKAYNTRSKDKQGQSLEQFATDYIENNNLYGPGYTGAAATTRSGKMARSIAYWVETAEPKGFSMEQFIEDTRQTSEKRKGLDENIMRSYASQYAPEHAEAVGQILIATSADQAALLNERTQDILDKRSKDSRHTTYSLLSGIDEAEIARMIADKELTEEKIAKVIAESELSSERSAAIEDIQSILNNNPILEKLLTGGDQLTISELKNIQEKGISLSEDYIKKLGFVNLSGQVDIQYFNEFIGGLAKTVMDTTDLTGEVENFTVEFYNAMKNKAALFGAEFTYEKDGKKQTESFLDAFNNLLSGLNLNDEKKKNLQKALYDINWADMDSIESFRDLVLQLAPAIDKTNLDWFIQKIVEVGGAVKDFTREEVETKGTSLNKIINEIKSGKQDRRFSKEDYQTIIDTDVTGTLAKNFVEMADGSFMLVNSSLGVLTQALENNTKALLENEVTELGDKAKISDAFAGFSFSAYYNDLGTGGQATNFLSQIENLYNQGVNFGALGIEAPKTYSEFEKLPKELQDTIFKQIEGIVLGGSGDDYRSQAAGLTSLFEGQDFWTWGGIYDILPAMSAKPATPSGGGGSMGIQVDEEEIQKYRLKGQIWDETIQENMRLYAEQMKLPEHYLNTYNRLMEGFSSKKLEEADSAQLKKWVEAQNMFFEAISRHEQDQKLEKTIDSLQAIQEAYGDLAKDSPYYKAAVADYTTAFQGAVDENFVNTYFQKIQEAANGNAEAMQEVFDLMNQENHIIVTADGDFSGLVARGEEAFEQVGQKQEEYLNNLYKLGNIEIVKYTVTAEASYPVMTKEGIQIQKFPVGETIDLVRPVGADHLQTVIGGSGGKSKSSGGSAPKKWENPYDEFYNSIEKINESLRTRERLEQRYQRLVNRNAANAAELANIQRDQLSLLEAERKEREYILRGRERQMSDIISEYSDVGKYAQWNQEKMRIEIDWNLLEKLDGSTDEKLTGRVEEFISKLEEQQKLIEEEKDSIESIEDATWEIYSSGKDEYLDLEGQIKEALVNARQREIDELSEINNSINDANSAILDSMQKQIDQERQLRDNQKTEEEIANKENRLAYLRQDTSGANALEIMKLEKEIDDQKQDHTDTLIDQKISDLQEQNDLAAEQRERQIEIMQGQLDWYEKSQQVWNDVHTLMQTGLDLENNLIKGSDLETILKGENGFESMSQIEQMNWLNELESLVANGLKWLSNGAMQSLYGVGAEVNFVNADGQLITGKINSSGDVEAEGQIYSGKNFFMSTSGDLTTTQTRKEASEAYKETITEPTPEPPTEPEEPSRTGWYFSKTGKRYWSRGDAEKAVNNWFNEEKVKLELMAAKNKMAISLSDIGALEQIRDRALASIRIHQFKTGGLADFTGPAWLDGTKSRPEYILNADQTKAFFSLVDVLSSLQSGSSKTTQNSGDNTYDIDINVESIGSDYDVERLADTVKRLINEDARYRNNNAINLMR